MEAGKIIRRNMAGEGIEVVWIRVFLRKRKRRFVEFFDGFWHECYVIP